MSHFLIIGNYCIPHTTNLFHLFNITLTKNSFRFHSRINFSYENAFNIILQMGQTNSTKLTHLFHKWENKERKTKFLHGPEIPKKKKKISLLIVTITEVKIHNNNINRRFLDGEKIFINFLLLTYLTYLLIHRKIFFNRSRAAFWWYIS